VIMARDPRGRAGGPTLGDVIMLLIVLLAIWSLVRGAPVWELITR
jgi:hypothetical protein